MWKDTELWETYLQPNMPCRTLRCGRHTCSQTCHSGPCSVCDVTIVQQCTCKRGSFIILCDNWTNKSFKNCGTECGKALRCGRHTCSQTCHIGPCSGCEVKICQQCICKRSCRKITCDEWTEESYHCRRICGKILCCGYHFCKLICHPSSLPPCDLLPLKTGPHVATLLQPCNPSRKFCSLILTRM
jgi:transcriptional repressor NF-X1